MALSKRLSCIAQLVQTQADALVDIGYDHGQLLHWAVQQGMTSVIGVELAQHFAITYVKKYPSDDVDLRTGDGLSVISAEDQLECLIIAGLGEERIRQLLDNHQDLMMRFNQIVVCPSSRDMKLHHYLGVHHWSASKEYLVEENGRMYCISNFTPGEDAQTDDAILSIAPRLFEDYPDQFESYRQFLLNSQLI